MNTPDRKRREEMVFAGRRRLADPFNGYLRQGKPDVAFEGMLDTGMVRRWIDVVSWASRTDQYTFQLPLDGRSGPDVTIEGEPLIMLSSYDYLGLLGHADIERAAHEAIERHGTGSGGVRLLTGTMSIHASLEAELAAFKRTEAAVTFSSGYLASVGAISALLGPRDRVVLDEKAHRSLFDACRLARVQTATFRHNDVGDLDHQLASDRDCHRTLVLVEGAYSMDGDCCPLPAIIEAKRRHGAFLMVDEAHSFGVCGKNGRGIDEHYGIDPDDVDIWMGSLSKAIPASGGFIAGNRDLIIYLQHGAAPFFFSAALCPSVAATARQAIRVIQREPERIRRVRENAIRLRRGLASMGYNTGLSEGPIIPVLIGADEDAYRIARELYDEGVLANAVVFPAVPLAQARLRLCATAAQSDELIDNALDAFARVRSRTSVTSAVGAVSLASST